MGIKEITLPKELLNLPQPWAKADFMHRHKQLDMLTSQPNEIETALNVLERCLHSLCLLSPLKKSGDLIPDSLMEYWGFTAQWLAEDMPTLDYFSLLKVEGKLTEYGIQSPPAALIVDLAEYWIWSVVFDIADSALYWVQRALMKTREPILISRFLYMAERYWQEVEPDFASSLLSRSATIGWQKALPLFESVEQNPKASEEVIETVQDYRELILDNRHKWLPESDPFSEWPTSENESDHLPQPALRQAKEAATQPALAELVYV
ncbi:MAG: hypothetical protein ACPGWR_05140 [Ardenticatenaceae bacterium]